MQAESCLVKSATVESGELLARTVVGDHLEGVGRHRPAPVATAVADSGYPVQGRSRRRRVMWPAAHRGAAFVVRTAASREGHCHRTAGRNRHRPPRTTLSYGPHDRSLPRTNMRRPDVRIPLTPARWNGPEAGGSCRDASRCSELAPTNSASRLPAKCRKNMRTVSPPAQNGPRVRPPADSCCRSEVMTADDITCYGRWQ